MGTSSSVAEVTGSDKIVGTTGNKTAMNGQKEQASSQYLTSTGHNEPEKKEPTTTEVVKTNEPVGGTEVPKAPTSETDKSKDASKDTEKPKEPPPPMSREEIDSKKKEVLEIVEAHIEKMKDAEWLDEEGKYVEGARKLVYGFSISYFALKNAPLPDIIESRKQIANACVKSDIITKICGVVTYIYPRGWTDEETMKIDPDRYNPLRSSLLFLLNYSDASPDLAERVAHTPGFLETVRKVLTESYEPHMKQEQTEQSHKVMKWCLSLSHNMSMVEANASELRSFNFTEFLKPYLQSPEKMYQLNVLATLAGIIDEKESEILNSNNESVKFLMEVLRNGLGAANRRHNGWSCKECALTIKLLARNDNNKKLLVELGALELLVELAKGTDEEQIEAVGAIWALSFDEDNRKVMVENEELGVITTLLNLKTTDDAKIKAAANGALWNLRGDLEKSKKFHDLGEHLSNGRHKKELKKKASIGISRESKEVELEVEEEGHIMISYQWKSQKTLMDVRDSLIANGFKVWMDIDQMGGSTLQAMADAVENATVVFICMSQKYKDSPNCRAEAEYAFQQRKKIVPLMLERGYKPDGWLGFILGAKLFYDFSGKYPFQDKLNDLLKELRRLKGQNQGAPKDVIVPQKAQPNYHQPAVIDVPDSFHPVPAITSAHVNITDDVRAWSSDDVKNWINKNSLPVQKFGNLTAGEIALLISMKTDAPESFYRCLQDMLKITDLLTMSKFVWALNDIGKQNSNVK